LNDKDQFFATNFENFYGFGTNLQLKAILLFLTVPPPNSLTFYLFNNPPLFGKKIEKKNGAIK